MTVKTENKITAGLAVIFFLVVLFLAISSADRVDGVPPHEMTPIDSLYILMEDIQASVNETTRHLNRICVQMAQTRGASRDVAVTYCAVNMP